MSANLFNLKSTLKDATTPKFNSTDFKISIPIPMRLTIQRFLFFWAQATDGIPVGGPDGSSSDDDSSEDEGEQSHKKASEASKGSRESQHDEL